MRIKEAAVALGISQDWLRELERNGKIPPVMRDLNRHRRFTDDDIHLLRKILFGKTPGDKAEWGNNG